MSLLGFESKYKNKMHLYFASGWKHFFLVLFLSSYPRQAYFHHFQLCMCVCEYVSWDGVYIDIDVPTLAEP